MRRSNRINFTKTALAALSAPTATSRVAFCDTKTRGLLLLVSVGGIKTFYVRRKLNGRSERICIGRFSEWSVERARAFADGINAAYGRGENPADLGRAKRSEMTLDNLFDEYMVRNGPHLRRPDKPRNNYHHNRLTSAQELPFRACSQDRGDRAATSVPSPLFVPSGG
jgi:hypothetical protein